MKKREWPEDGHPEEPIEVEGVMYENLEGLPYKTRMSVIFEQEAKRISRFDGYRRKAEEYLNTAKEARAYADQTLSLVMKILMELPFPKVVLEVENVIKKSRPIVQRTVVMLGNDTEYDHKGIPRYNQNNLSSAGMTSQLAWLELAKILKGVDVQPDSPKEGQMDLPEITDRQKRVAKDKGIPQEIRKREIPRLSEELQQGLNRFALGNMLYTLHDIDGLMYTLKDETDYFKEELADWKRLDEIVRSMIQAGKPKAEVRRTLLDHNFKERTQQFHEMYLRLDAALKICLARMEFINEKDNKLMSEEYDMRLLVKMLREVISGKQGQEVGFVRKFIAKALGRAQSAIPEKTGKSDFEQTLRKAIKRRREEQD